MLYLILLCVLVAALVGPGWTRRLGRLLARAPRGRAVGSWRPGMGVFALACVVAGLAAGVRGEWLLAAGGGVLSAVTALAARRRGPAPIAGEPPPRPPTGRARPSRREAADLLGLGPDASEGQIRAAHARLIRVAHPDRGGTAALAAQLNAARDVLLGKE